MTVYKRQGRKRWDVDRMQFFSAEDVSRLLPMDAAIDLMEAALRELAQGEVELPLRSVMLFGERKIFGHMPAWFKRQDVVGTKIITMVPGNRGRNIPSHQGLILLFSADHGTPLAVVDAESVTAIRTAAVSGVATRHLARPEARVLAILGTGQQARTHLQAMLTVRSFERVLVWGPHPERVAAFQEAMGPLSPVRIEAASSARDAVAPADVICTVTSSTTPIVAGGEVKDGAHINAVGACRPDERELDSVLMVRSRLYVDRRESAENEAGDYLIPLGEGVVGPDHIVGELGDLLAGRVPGRQQPSQVTVFKSLGLALEDIASAYAIYQKGQADDHGGV